MSATLDRDELARLRREAFGFVFQSYNLIAAATAAENVEVPAIYAGAAGRRAARARATQLLDHARPRRAHSTTGRTSSPAASSSACRSRAR